MAREAKIGLLVALGIILLIGIIVSDHLSVVNQQEAASVTDFAPEAQGNLSPVAEAEGQGEDPAQDQARGRSRPQRRSGPVPLPEEAPGGFMPSDQPQTPDSEPGSPQQREDPGHTVTPDFERHMPLSQPWGEAAEGPRASLADHQAVIPDRTRAAREGGSQADGGRSADRPRSQERPGQPSGRYYTVKPNESLWKIAQQQLGAGKHWKQIADANPDKVDAVGNVRQGARLLIPRLPGARTGSSPANAAPPPAAARVTPGQPAANAGQERGGADSARVVPSAPRGESQPGAARTVEVQVGDNLTKIAKRHLGDGGKYYRLYKANRDRLDSPDDVLRPGMKLRLPELTEAEEAALAAGSSGNGGSAELYTVQQGDTLSEISQKFYQTKDHWKRIMKANDRLLRGAPENLQAGQRLVLPSLEQDEG